MGQDYYKLLGVDKSATDAQLKSAYKKAALKHHPDRNPNDTEGASKRFKEVSEVSTPGSASATFPTPNHSIDTRADLVHLVSPPCRPTKHSLIPTSGPCTTSSARKA